MYDITIIGAGIIGTLLAHELSKYELKVLVLEKENDVAEGATGANSAMIHSGHDPKPGTLKCRYNLEGNRMYPDLCKELQVEYQPVGAFVVAVNEEELQILEMLKKQCEDREIPYELLDGDQARELEPHLSDEVIRALSLPTTGIVMPFEVAIAAMEEAMLNGVELRLGYEVKSIKKEEDFFLINNEIKSRTVVNCAGVYCQHITEMLRESPYRVEARKGEYFVLDHLDGQFVRRVIYPVPGTKGKGVLAVPTTHENVMLGPDSEVSRDVDDVSTTGKGLEYVRDQINKTVKDIPYHRMIHTFAGLRPHIDLNDFYIREDDRIDGFIHIAGIESPGLTAAPAIARDVTETILLPKYHAARKEQYKRRKAFIDISKLSIEELNELIARDPDYGRIVCRCERISKAQIKDVIHRLCGARTIKGVKRRCRPGMGRCQGGFCEPEVTRILAEELGLSIEEIMLDKDGSNIVTAKAKEDL